MLRSSTSGSGRKSASKIRMNSPLAVRRPFSSAPALKPERSTRWTYSIVELGEAARELGDLALADLLRLVGRVVEHLDLEAVARVADARDGLEQPLDDVHLVEERELDRHARQIGEHAQGPRPLVAVPVEHPDERAAVESVGGERQQDDEVSADDQ